ncbi:MAG: hypothetical protein FWE16_01470 [Firmicutes bacterium]|nr:hypothetical protein [Bacillota bacterium]
MSEKIKNTSFVDIELCEDTVTVTSQEVEVSELQLSVVKTAMCPFAVVGGTIKFCTTIKNTTGFTIHELVFRDELDENLSYVEGSFTVNGGQEDDPTIIGRVITFPMEKIEDDEEIVICFKVRVNSWPTGDDDNGDENGDDNGDE